MKKLLSTALSLALLLTLFTFNTYAANYDYDDPGIVKGDNTTYPELKRGDTGELVEELQGWLNTFYHNSDVVLDIDGSFGSKTEKEVIKFQKHYDWFLDVDGIVGELTWHCIYNIAY